MVGDTSRTGEVEGVPVVGTANDPSPSLHSFGPSGLTVTTRTTHHHQKDHQNYTEHRKLYTKRAPYQNHHQDHPNHYRTTKVQGPRSKTT